MGKRTLLIFTALSALMVFLSFPPAGWWGLAILAWSPFFIIVRELKPAKAFRYGLLHGLLLFPASLCWFWNIFSFGAVALWAALALYTAIWAWSYAGLCRREIPCLPLLGAVLFTGIEYFRGEFAPLAFPWITPGTGLPPNLLTSVFGTYGVTFAIVLSNLLLIQPGKKTEISGLLVALTILGTIITTPDTDEYESPSNKAVKVGMVQDESLKMSKYLEMSLFLPGFVDIIVWPEYALENDPHTAPEINADVSSLLGKRAQLVIAGGPTWGDVETQEWHNTAYTFGKDGILNSHFKNKPVHFFNDGKAGNEAKAFDTPIARLGTPVCFDADFQGIVRKMVADGAELLFVPAMNRREWSETQHEQHGIHIRHRAIENGRWIAMAATSGVTQIIDPYGNVVKKLPLMESSTLVGEVYPETRKTYFQKVGWLFGPMTLCVAALFFCHLFYLSYQDNKNSKHSKKTKAAKIDKNDPKVKKTDSQVRAPKSFYD